MKRNFDNAETLIRVENLCQYFKMGKRELKAVNNVSFDIKKGEVFGLVGESGCGKTTTGRTIIKLYNATSGDVYFRGQRIVAGIRSYKENISKKRAELKEAIAALDKNAADFNERKTALTAEANAYIKEQREEIKKAKHDQKCCDKEYAAKLQVELKTKYADLIAEASSQEEKEKLQQELNAELKKAKRAKLVTKIQMIFQDPPERPTKNVNWICKTFALRMWTQSSSSAAHNSKSEN